MCIVVAFVALDALDAVDGVVVREGPGAKILTTLYAKVKVW